MLVSQHQLGKSGALYSAWRFITCNQWQTLTPKSWGSVFWCLLNFFSLLVWILFRGEWNLAHVFVITKCGSLYCTCLKFKHKWKDLIFRNFSTIISSVYVYVAPGLWFSDLDVAVVTLFFASPSYYSICRKHWLTGISHLLVCFLLQASKVRFTVGSQVWVEDADVAWIDGLVEEVQGDELIINCSSGKKVSY